MRKALDTDQFVLSASGAYYVAFLNAGYNSDDATLLAEYAMAHPDKLLEDCRPSTVRLWKMAKEG